MTTNDPQIARTIISQLGGALAMLGAHSLVDQGDGLSFKIRGSRRVLALVIRLDPSDTYSIKAYRAFSWEKPMQTLLVEERSDVYADGLHEAIKSLTGLETVLFPRKSTSGDPWRARSSERRSTASLARRPHRRSLTERWGQRPPKGAPHEDLEP